LLYLTEEPLKLSGRKYERMVGPVPAVSYEQGIAETVRAIMERQSKTL